MIAVPTTAGSGSEVTHFAVVYVGTEKYSLASQHLLPDAVILDGALVQSGSRYLKTCSVLDAMAQAVESYWAVNLQLMKVGNSLIRHLNLDGRSYLSLYQNAAQPKPLQRVTEIGKSCW